jgi:hypothetical protein
MQRACGRSYPPVRLKTANTVAVRGSIVAGQVRHLPLDSRASSMALMTWSGMMPILSGPTMLTRNILWTPALYPAVIGHRRSGGARRPG